MYILKSNNSYEILKNYKNIFTCASALRYSRLNSQCFILASKRLVFFLKTEKIFGAEWTESTLHNFSLYNSK